MNVRIAGAKLPPAGKGSETIAKLAYADKSDFTTQPPRATPCGS
jgi:hypothetical protein